MKKALIITYSGFQDHEVIYPYHSLKENNFEVNIIANEIGRFYGILGCHMICDTLTSEFEDAEKRRKFLEYDLLVIPGGVKALEKLRLEKGIVEFVKEWNALDKTIFSLCNGAQLLITADVIRDKVVSGYYAIEADINNAGATYHRGPVVVDKNIVSSPHYDFMGEWMRIGYEVLEKRGK
jgi:protease I